MTRMARLAAFIIGFLSLSSELLWIRLVGYSLNSRPQAFSLVLGAFLTGIAIGALIGRAACNSGRSLWTSTGLALVAAGLVDLSLPWLVAGTHSSPDGLWIALVCVALSALCKAVAFPILHELGTRATTTGLGASFAYVYVSNIAGSCLGPILTGYFLLEIFSTQEVFHLLGVLSLLTGLACLLPHWRLKHWATLAASLWFVSCSLNQVPPQLLPALAWMPDTENLLRLRENRYGILQVSNDKMGLRRVYGGNTYDGAFNIEPGDHRNRIERAYFAAAIHPAPRRVLMIGLSSGSWLAVLTQHPDIESIDVVEINPGYLDLMGPEHTQMRALADPRVRVHIDDGRRWLRRHQGAPFDLVVMNTSIHWKNFATAVLSTEFMALVKSRLAADGIIYYNTTSSIDAAFTSSTRFREVFLFENFALATDRPVMPLLAGVADTLTRFSLPNPQAATGPRLPSLSAEQASTISSMPLVPLADYIRKAGRAPEVITDSNMVSEFRYGLALDEPYR